jgi:gentisate 1,2-dioxygenase
MDGLDIPLIASLEAMFFQFYTQTQVPASRPAHTSLALYGTGQLNPTWVKEKTNASPLLLYSWEQTWKALDALRGQTGSAFDGICLEYRHPQTGGTVLLTTGLPHPAAAQRTQSAPPYRQRGLPCGPRPGQMIIDGKNFAWRKGDIIALPPWSLHEHINSSAKADAVLFSIQDAPVLQALGLYYEEEISENGGHQKVTSAFGA